MAEVSLDLTPSRGHVIVDGDEIRHVAELTLTAKPKQLPVLTLDVLGTPVRYSGEAEVVVRLEPVIVRLLGKMIVALPLDEVQERADMIAESRPDLDATGAVVCAVANLLAEKHT